MRHELQAKYPAYAGKVKFYIGDVRNPRSSAMSCPASTSFSTLLR